MVMPPAVLVRRRLAAPLSPFSPVLDSCWAFLVALACGAVVLLLTGHDPIDAYQQWLQRGLLRPVAWQETLVRATPLVFTGLAVLVALRTGLWNIGVDGQVLAGAMAAAIVASTLDDVPRVLMWVLAAGAGVIAGAAWGMIPALLRSVYGVNEIVTTLMFNYVAAALTAWLVKGPVGDPSVVSPQTHLIAREDRLTTLGDTRLHLGLLAAVLALLAVRLFFARTMAGFEMTVIGKSVRTAKHAHIPVVFYLTVALVISGALAALAGVNDVLSTKGTFQAGWNPQYGLTTFVVVFLAQRRIWGLVPAAIVMGQLSYAADIMPRAAGVAPAFFGVIEGVLLMTLALFVWARSGMGRLRSVGAATG